MENNENDRDAANTINNDDNGGAIAVANDAADEAIVISDDEDVAQAAAPEQNATFTAVDAQLPAWALPRRRYKKCITCEGQIPADGLDLCTICFFNLN